MLMNSTRALREADSVTVDPHKAGYVPYPAGAVCYRNAAMRDLISLRAPVIFHNQAEPTVGVYGVEGSKPGAAAAAVWLAHKVIRPDRSGYGRNPRPVYVDIKAPVQPAGYAAGRSLRYRDVQAIAGRTSRRRSRGNRETVAQGQRHLYRTDQ